VAVVDFLRNLARACGGLLLHLDDVQWLDAATSRIMVRLVAGIRDVPLLVLCTARDDPASLAATEAFCTSLGAGLDLDLSLGPLDEQGVAALVAGQLPGLPANSVLSRLLAVRSNGSPFVALEYLRAIVDAGLLSPSWGGWALDEDGLGALELPRDALGLVAARADALGPDSRRVLTVAAVVGSRFLPNVVAAVSAVALHDVHRAVAEATGHRLVEPNDEGEIVFLHERIREALLEGLDEQRLRNLHRRIADALGQEADRRPRAVYALAHHYLLADQDGAQAQVFSACFAAGRLALADYAAGTAVRFLDHAADTGEPLDWHFLRTRGLALYRNGQYSEAKVCLE
jgi:predicted ATPase